MVVGVTYASFDKYRDKGLGWEFDHSFKSRAEGNITWSYTSYPTQILVAISTFRWYILSRRGQQGENYIYSHFNYIPTRILLFWDKTLASLGNRFPTFRMTDFSSTQRKISEEPNTQSHRFENLKNQRCVFMNL
jgi:hypothetical protein